MTEQRGTDNEQLSRNTGYIHTTRKRTIKMKQEDYKILSIARLSDNVVFKVGDTITTIYNTTAIVPRVIEEIRIDRVPRTCAEEINSRSKIGAICHDQMLVGRVKYQEYLVFDSNEVILSPRIDELTVECRMELVFLKVERGLNKYEIKVECILRTLELVIYSRGSSVWRNDSEEIVDSSLTTEVDKLSEDVLSVHGLSMEEIESSMREFKNESEFEKIE